MNVSNPQVCAGYKEINEHVMDAITRLQSELETTTNELAAMKNRKNNRDDVHEKKKHAKIQELQHALKELRRSEQRVNDLKRNKAAAEKRLASMETERDAKKRSIAGLVKKAKAASTAHQRFRRDATKKEGQLSKQRNSAQAKLSKEQRQNIKLKGNLKKQMAETLQPIVDGFSHKNMSVRNQHDLFDFMVQV